MNELEYYPENKRCDCKNCSIGNYIKSNFYNIEGNRAKCAFCIDRKISATKLPLQELWRRMNHKDLKVIVETYYPSINNYCPKCGQLYDDGKAYKCPKCGSITTKRFTKKVNDKPNWYYRYEFNKFFNKFKKIYFE